MNSAIDAAKSAGDLAPIAQQYGPFFFTVFYTLIVLVLGQEIIRRRLSNAVDMSPTELNERIRSQRAYRTFAISMAGFCLTFSMFWWGYTQIYPPSSKIEQLVKDQIAKVVFQGQITDLSPDDVLISSDDVNYTAYVWTDTHAMPAMTRFVIVAKSRPMYGQPVSIYYGNEKSLQAAGPAIGYAFHPLEFCLNESATKMRMIKAQDGPPRLSNPCKKDDKL
ncbi:hypothetical protein KZX46_20890 [Polymorphobacter sp. PAMC 29334]|uniref:hypothetical protein n=1 Tax=Polymorphobacter sp. PAMC 29334 TaxID=2862331 RepID=UPI001C793183|nr:hypothetical protein [Polymorphobacter sp. PAMC 29334]QYE35136.1 hypothetical protein KZX46_20890 [Polymorphobacter sp. PAMC 29334]